MNCRDGVGIFRNAGRFGRVKIVNGRDFIVAARDFLLAVRDFILAVRDFLLAGGDFLLAGGDLVSAVRIKIITGHKFESDGNVFISARKNKITAVNTLITAFCSVNCAGGTKNKISGSNNCVGGTKNNHSGTIFGVFRTNVCAAGTPAGQF